MVYAEPVSTTQYVDNYPPPLPTPLLPPSAVDNNNSNNIYENNNNNNNAGGRGSSSSSSIPCFRVVLVLIMIGIAIGGGVFLMLKRSTGGSDNHLIVVASHNLKELWMNEMAESFNAAEITFTNEAGQTRYARVQVCHIGAAFQRDPCNSSSDDEDGQLPSASI